MKPQKAKPQSIFRSFGFYLLVLLAAGFLIFGFFQSSPNGEKKPISDVLSLIKEGKVKQITVDEDTLNVELKTGDQLQSIKETGKRFVE